ncbi:hypothetical protein [Agaribacter flavus]|uniref:Cohesin domain-containing protein n=1 Tax=Agaribacter flavus TaxID=1902781 RepID=A0ABV7FRA5_9ALTE
MFTLRSTKLLIVLLIFGTSITSKAALIELRTSNNAISPSSEFEVSVWVSNLGTDLLASYDIELGFDPVKAAFSSIVFDDKLGADLFSFSDHLPSSSSVLFTELSLLPSNDLLARQMNQAFRLATLKFTSLHSGLATFNIISHTLISDMFLPISATTQGLRVNSQIQDVASPSIWLLAYSLVLLMVLKPREKVVLGDQS